MLRPWFVCALLMVGSAIRLAPAEDPPEKLRGWLKLFQEHAAEYKFSVAGKSDQAVQLVSQPILQWSQPVRGGDDGSVYIWTQAGRPVAMATLFIWPIGNGKQGVSHELHSLSVEPLTAKWRDRQWTPPKDSVVWTPLETAQAPAATSEPRLRQMREMAKQFQAESQDKNDRRWELRLLPRPIYRYGLDEESPAEEREILDGALFGFVEGTDLEVVLLLQAPRAKTGYAWEFAFARMSDFRLKAKLGERTVWEVERSRFDQPKAAYNCSTVESRTSPEEK